MMGYSVSCIKCGGDMIGDGYTSVLRCEYVEDAAYSQREPDSEPVYCEHEPKPSKLEGIKEMRRTYLNNKMEFDGFITVLLRADKAREKLLAEGANADADAIDFAKYHFGANNENAIVIGVHHRLMNSPLVDLHHFFCNTKREFLKLEDRRKNPQTDEVMCLGAFK